MALDPTRVFKAYDIRGVYPDELDEAMARAVGRALVAVTGARAVAVGQDTRVSSEPLAQALAEGVISQGADVVRVGLCSTDMLYFVSGKLDVAGVMITASHNPAQYNGLKLCRPGAAPIGEESGLRDIASLIARGAPEQDVVPLGTISERPELLEEFADHVRSFVDVGELRPLKVVADAGNGMAGLVVPAVFSKLPFDLVPMYFDLDGTFPNHPANPIDPANVVDLQARVLAEGADVGLAFDGDADRVFLVDEQGQVVESSLVVALVGAALCRSEPGATILYNLICSRVVPETIRAGGCTAVRTRVGHSFIKQVMAETNAVFGGEHSGHYYFRNNFRADSGLIAALVVLQECSRSGVALSEMLAPYRRYAASGEINRRVHEPANTILERVASHYPDLEQDMSDGMSVRAAQWWFNLRPSNTEPLLRLNVEAPTVEQMQELRDEVLALVGGEPA